MYSMGGEWGAIITEFIAKSVGLLWWTNACLLCSFKSYKADKFSQPETLHSSTTTTTPPPENQKSAAPALWHHCSKDQITETCVHDVIIKMDL